MTAASLGQTRSRHAAFLDALASPTLLFAVFAAGTLLLHLACAGGYGYQRDELYFLACAQHLAWGYVDQPPLIAVIAAMSTALFGDSLQAIRFFPAVAAAATVVLTGLLARRLGAGPFGIAIAMGCVIVSPFFLYVGNLLTMNAFEPLLWTGGAFVMLQIIDGQRPVTARWFALSAIVALGVLNKYTMGFFAIAVFAGLAVTNRHVLRGIAVPAACVLLLALIAPNLAWQSTHGWPQMELLLHAQTSKNPSLSPIAFFFEQALMMNPATLPVWIAGLAALWRGWEGRYRTFAVAYGALIVAFAVLHGKVYYLASIYPLLFAAGASPIEALLKPKRLRVGYALVLAAFGVLIAPQVLPLLSLDRFVAYQRFLDFRHVREEQHAVGRVPQQFADMLGWDSFVATVNSAYQNIPSDRRGRTAIWTRNYGMAGAVDVLGSAYGLPKAISGHNNYYIWGPRGYTGESVLAVGLPKSFLQQEFGDVRRAGTFSDPWVLPDENNVALYYCSRPKMPLAIFWPRTKAYI